MVPFVVSAIEVFYPPGRREPFFGYDAIDIRCGFNDRMSTVAGRLVCTRSEYNRAPERSSPVIASACRAARTSMGCDCRARPEGRPDEWREGREQSVARRSGRLIDRGQRGRVLRHGDHGCLSLSVSCQATPTLWTIRHDVQCNIDMETITLGACGSQPPGGTGRPARRKRREPDLSALDDSDAAENPTDVQRRHVGWFPAWMIETRPRRARLVEQVGESNLGACGTRLFLRRTPCARALNVPFWPVLDSSQAWPPTRVRGACGDRPAPVAGEREHRHADQVPGHATRQRKSMTAGVDIRLPSGVVLWSYRDRQCHVAREMM